MDKEKIKKNANEIKEKADEIIKDANEIKEKADEIIKEVVEGNEGNEMCNEKNFLISNAILQDNLLQNYRLIFITSQSILIPLSALILTTIWYNYPNKDSLSFLTALGLLIIFSLSIIGIIMLHSWVKITRSRGLDVSYWHMKLLEYENFYKENKPFMAFKEWQGKSREEKKEQLKNFQRNNKIDLLTSDTRRKLEGLVPLLFFILWLIIIAFTSMTIVYYLFQNKMDIFFAVITAIIVTIPLMVSINTLLDGDC